MATSIKPHPAFKYLRSHLKKSEHALTAQWQGPVYRCVELEWAHPEYLITGEGTRQRGSRWMQPNRCRVVHAASTDTIALKESRRVYDYYGIRKARNNPRVCVELMVQLQRLVDLTRLKTIMDSPTLEEMLNEDWEKLNGSRVETVAQSLGRAILELDYEGLIAPSSRDRRGRNLVWFPSELLAGSEIKIVGREKLKQWLA